MIAPSLDLARQAGAIHRRMEEIVRLREEAPRKVDEFVGVFYGQMLQSMRQTLPGNPMFGGGRAEEVFTGQLDQEMGLRMAAKTTTRLDGEGRLVERHNPLTEDFMRSYNRSLDRQASYWQTRLAEVEAALAAGAEEAVPDEDALGRMDDILSSATRRAEDLLIEGADRTPVPLAVAPETGRKLKFH